MLIAFFGLRNPAGVRELQLHFSERSTRPAWRMEPRRFDPAWRESHLAQQLPGLAWRCYANGADRGNLGERSCFADIASFNDIEAYNIGLHFGAGGELRHVVLQLPMWQRQALRNQLLDSLGKPSVAQPRPLQGVRLLGWQLDGGAGLFVERDTVFDPFRPTALMWSSPRVCATSCFRPGAPAAAR